MKANLRKAKPNILKAYGHWLIAIIPTWMLARFYAEFYEMVWPNIGLIQFVLDVFEKHPILSSGISGGGGLLIGLYHLFEVYRKR